MNQQMQDWLKQHGQENVFAMYSKEQCETLLANLTSQLEAEEELELAARHVMAHTQFVLDEDEETSPSLAEPETQQPTPEPARRSWASSPLLWTITSAVCVCMFALWSVLVYNYGAKSGRTTQQNEALMACRSAPPTPLHGRMARPAAAHLATVASEPMTKIEKPMLIQPSLRVEMNVSKPNVVWRNLGSSRWNTSHRDLLPAGMTSPSNSPLGNSPWFGANRSRWRLPLGTRKPSLRPKPRLELTPLQISRTTF